MPAKKKIQQIERFAQSDLVPKIEIKDQPADLITKLEEMKAKDEVIGYLLRTQTSATVDIKDPSKIIDYAVLSTVVLESAESLSEAFALGKICNIAVVGSELKVLLLPFGENTVSVFMNKDADHASICKKLT